MVTVFPVPYKNPKILPITKILFIVTLQTHGLIERSWDVYMKFWKSKNV